MARIEKFIRSQRELPMALFCTREQNVAGSIYGPVIRDVYIFECCTQGRGSIIINGKEFFFQEGDFYVLFPGDAVGHTCDKEHPRGGYSCYACGLTLRHMLARAGINSSQPFAPKELYPRLLEEMKAMYAMNKEDDPGAELRRTAYLYRILGEILREGKERSRDSLIQKAVDIMETRYFEDISVEDLSNEVGLERSYFSTFFKDRTGFSPHRYLTRLRIQKACALMDQRDLAVFEAAESVGLDPQNFSRLFKKEMEMTPLQYKKRENR